MRPRASSSASSAPALAGLVVSLIAQVLGAGLIKNALNVVDGKPVSLSEIGDVGDQAAGDRGRPDRGGRHVQSGRSCATSPASSSRFLLNWTMFYVVDKDMAPMDAAKASVKFVTDHLGDTIVFYLLGIVVLIVGAILCLVGLLVAAPVMLIAAALHLPQCSTVEQVTPAADPTQVGRQTSGHNGRRALGV